MEKEQKRELERISSDFSSRRYEILESERDRETGLYGPSLEYRFDFFNRIPFFTSLFFVPSTGRIASGESYVTAV